MQFFTKTAITAAAMTALVQLSPAPILIAIPIALDVGLGTAAACVSAAASVAGTVVGAVKDKREAVGIPQHPHQIRSALESRQEMNQAAWQSCKDQLAGAHLNFSADSPGSEFPLSYHINSQLFSPYYQLLLTPLGRRPRHWHPFVLHDAADRPHW